MITRPRAATALLAALCVGLTSCSDEECPTEACEDEIFHLDGDEIFATLVRWLILAVGLLVAVVVVGWIVRRVRQRWFPRDVDW